MKTPEKEEKEIRDTCKISKTVIKIALIASTIFILIPFIDATLFERAAGIVFNLLVGSISIGALSTKEELEILKLKKNKAKDESNTDTK